MLERGGGGGRRPLRAARGGRRAAGGRRPRPARRLRRGGARDLDRLASRRGGRGRRPPHPPGRDRAPSAASSLPPARAAASPWFSTTPTWPTRRRSTRWHTSTSVAGAAVLIVLAYRPEGGPGDTDGRRRRDWPAPDGRSSWSWAARPGGRRGAGRRRREHAARRPRRSSASSSSAEGNPFLTLELARSSVIGVPALSPDAGAADRRPLPPARGGRGCGGAAAGARRGRL